MQGVCDEELLSRPSPAVISVIGGLTGRLAILGAGGKMGPSLTRMTCRARDAAGADLDIVAVSRFSDAAVAERVGRAGARTVRCDLLDAEAVADLPSAENVIYMVGLKFGKHVSVASLPRLPLALGLLKDEHDRLLSFRALHTSVSRTQPATPLTGAVPTLMRSSTRHLDVSNPSTPRRPQLTRRG